MASGAREITLLGQNVNAYHGAAPRRSAAADEWGLGRLIRHLAEIDGLARIRYTTSHPRDMDDDLIAAHGDVPQLMPFLHLPVQSGSDRDPGGDEPAAQRPITICASSSGCAPRRPTSRCRPISSSAFPARATPISRRRWRWSTRSASPRPIPSSTAPAPARRRRSWRSRCPEAVKDERLERLQALLRRQQAAFNRATVGRTLPVLFEQPGRHAASLSAAPPICRRCMPRPPA